MHVRPRVPQACLEETRHQKTDRRQRLSSKMSLPTAPTASTPVPTLMPMVVEATRACVDIDGKGYLNRRCTRLFSPTRMAATIATPPRSRLARDEADEVDEEHR
jgi:hypothetical protein